MWGGKWKSWGFLTVRTLKPLSQSGCGPSDFFSPPSILPHPLIADQVWAVQVALGKAALTGSILFKELPSSAVSVVINGSHGFGNKRENLQAFCALSAGRWRGDVPAGVWLGAGSTRRAVLSRLRVGWRRFRFPSFSWRPAQNEFNLVSKRDRRALGRTVRSVSSFPNFIFWKQWKISVLCSAVKGPLSQTSVKVDKVFWFSFNRFAENLWYNL